MLLQAASLRIVKLREVMLTALTALTAPDKCPVEGRGAVWAAPRHLLSPPGESGYTWYRTAAPLTWALMIPTFGHVGST